MEKLNLLLENFLMEEKIDSGKTFNMLCYKYPDIPENLIRKVVEKDPTKKKSYSQWMVPKYMTEPKLFTQVVNSGKLERLFQYFRENNDIQFNRFNSLKDAISVLPKEEGEDDHIFSESEIPEENNYDIVYDSPEWRICVPNCFEADRRLGKDTRWCTTGCYDGTANYYNKYLNDYGGVYYVNFDKQRNERLKGTAYPYKRSQFHFESNQFLDSNNHTFDILSEISDGAMDFYAKKGYNVPDCFENYEVRKKRYENRRREYSVRLIGGYMLMPTYDDNFVLNINNSTEYNIYNEDDEREPLAEGMTFKKNAKVEIIENIGIAIVYGVDGDFAIVQDDTDSSYSKTDFVFQNISSFEPISKNGNTVGVYAKNNYGEYIFFNCLGNESIGIGNSGAKGLKTVNIQAKGFDNAVFFETLYDDDVKGLYVFFPNEVSVIEPIIYKDRPGEGGEDYICNENGIIRGEYRSYSIDGISNEDDDTFGEMEFVSDLIKGNRRYKLFMRFSRQYGIYDMKKKEFITIGNFGNLFSGIQVLEGPYCKITGVSMINGKSFMGSIVVEFSEEPLIKTDLHHGISFGVSKDGDFIVVGNERVLDMTSFYNCRVYNLSKGIKSPIFKSIEGLNGNGRIFVRTDDGFHIYDYTNNELYLDSIEKASVIGKFAFCQNIENGLISIIGTDKVYANNVSRVNGILKGHGIGKIVSVSFTDGRENVFWTGNGEMLFSENQETILKNVFTHKGNDCVIAQTNGYVILKSTDGDGLKLANNNYTKYINVSQNKLYFNFNGQFNVCLDTNDFSYYVEKLDGCMLNDNEVRYIIENWMKGEQISQESYLANAANSINEVTNRFNDMLNRMNSCN